MAKQLTDTALRVLVARWVKAALGELVEDDEVTPGSQLAPGLREKVGPNPSCLPAPRHDCRCRAASTTCSGRTRGEETA